MLDHTPIHLIYFFFKERPLVQLMRSVVRTKSYKSPRRYLLKPLYPTTCHVYVKQHMYFAAALVLLVVTLDLHGVMHRASRRTRRGHTFLSRPGGSRGWAALATLLTSTLFEC